MAQHFCFGGDACAAGRGIALEMQLLFLVSRVCRIVRTMFGSYTEHWHWHCSGVTHALDYIVFFDSFKCALYMCV